MATLIPDKLQIKNNPTRKVVDDFQVEVTSEFSGNLVGATNQKEVNDKVDALSTSSGGGHTIQGADSVPVAQESVLEFGEGLEVTPATGKTVVTSGTLKTDGTEGNIFDVGDLCYYSPEITASLADYFENTTYLGYWQRCDNRNPYSCQFTLGIKESSGKFLRPGNIHTTTGLTKGAVYYVGTFGGITDIQPDAPGATIRIVGHALSATDLYFNPSNDWFELATTDELRQSGGLAFTVDNCYANISRLYGYKGGTHCHTSGGSDGWQTVTQLVTSYKDHGYDFVWTTDHSFYAYTAGSNIFQPRQEIAGIQHFRGIEHSYGNTDPAFDVSLLDTTDSQTKAANSDCGHVNILFHQDSDTALYVPPAEGVWYSPIEDQFSAFPDAFFNIHHHYAAISNPFKHNWMGSDPEELIRHLGQFHALELKNNNDSYDWESLGRVLTVHGQGNCNDVWYDLALGSGKKLYATAGDDHHGSEANPTSGVGNSWLIVYVPDAALTASSQGAIVDAMREGRFYASSGMEDVVIAVTNTTYTITTPTTSTITWYGVAAGIPGAILQTDTGVTTATYTFVGDEKYVRCHAQDLTNKTEAWGNPVFIKPKTHVVRINGKELKGDLTSPAISGTITGDAKLNLTNSLTDSSPIADNVYATVDAITDSTASFVGNNRTLGKTTSVNLTSSGGGIQINKGEFTNTGSGDITKTLMNNAVVNQNNASSTMAEVFGVRTQFNCFAGEMTACYHHYFRGGSHAGIIDEVGIYAPANWVGSYFLNNQTAAPSYLGGDLTVGAKITLDASSGNIDALSFTQNGVALSISPEVTVNGTVAVSLTGADLGSVEKGFCNLRYKTDGGINSLLTLSHYSTANGFDKDIEISCNADSLTWNAEALSALTGTATQPDIPAQFKIGGTALSANSTAANINALTGGGETALHSHASATQGSISAWLQGSYTLVSAYNARQLWVPTSGVSVGNASHFTLDATTGKITVTNAGTYIISFAGYAVNSTTASLIEVRIYKNGSVITGTAVNTTHAAGSGTEYSANDYGVALSAGDYIQLYTKNSVNEVAYLNGFRLMVHRIV